MDISRHSVIPRLPGFLTVVLTGALAYYLHSWIAMQFAWVTVPITVAVLAVVLNRRAEENFLQKASLGRAAPATTDESPNDQRRFAAYSAVLASASILLGALITRLLIDPYNLTLNFSAAPPILIMDIMGSLPKVVLSGLAEANPVTGSSGILFVYVQMVLAALIASGVSILKKRRVETLAPVIILVVLSLNLIYAAFATTETTRELARFEAPDYACLYDGCIYRKAYAMMDRMGFYEAYVQAFGTRRDAVDIEIVRDGKFVGHFVTSPLIWREPLIFYIWRFVAPQNADNIFVLGVALAVSSLYFCYLIGVRMVGPPGIFLSFAPVPYIISAITWSNLYLPDIFAGFAVLAAVFLWVNKQYGLSAVAFLLAALFREVLFPLLIVFGIVAFFKRRTTGKYFLAGSLVFIVSYYFHYTTAAKFIAVGNSAKETLVPKLTSEHFISASSYLVYPYTKFQIPAFVLLLLAAAGWALFKRWELVGFTALAALYFGIATSSYWGQHFWFALIPAAFLPLLWFFRAEEAREES